MDDISFQFDFGNAELDFDINDFDLDDGEGKIDLYPPDTRYWKPRIQTKSVLRNVAFRNARDFARNIELGVDGTRTYCWLDGGFIFGDVIEALYQERHIQAKEIWISSLSLSLDNIESLKNIYEYGGNPEINLLLSAYFYSHEKNGIVREMYEQLDKDNKFQVGFTNVHSKIIAIETTLGNHIVIHGSSNLRSSQSIEQVMVECDDDLYRFNVEIMRSLLEKCKTINKRFGGKISWQAVLEGVTRSQTTTCAERSTDTSQTEREQRQSDGQTTHGGEA